MKTVGIHLKFGAAAVLLCLSALSVQAATITAASTAHGDIAAAISNANDGDTVQIPAGNSTWTSSLTITKAITLRGAGMGNTFIRSGTNILILQPANDLTMRVTGIYFDLGSFEQSDLSAIITAGATISNLRIDHCGFRGGSRSVYLQALTYGVLDHCAFLNSDSDINPFQAGADGTGSTSWVSPILPGTTKTFVIETNTFTRDNNITSDPNEVIYGQNGARCCFRYNTVTQTATTRPLAAMDAHGYNPSWGHGTCFYEVYNNTFHCNNTYRFCYLRGGTQIWHDNAFITDDGNSPTVFSITNEQGTSQDVIKDSFFYNNTLNGSSSGTDATLEGGYSNSPVLNRDFFNRPMQSGDKYYPYTPLVYPHPRVTAEDSQGPPAVELRITASGQ